MFHIDGSQCLGQYQPEIPGDGNSLAVLVPGTCHHAHHGLSPKTWTPPVRFKPRDMATWTQAQRTEAWQHSVVNKHAPTCICNRPHGDVGKCDCGKTDEDEEARLLEIQSRRGQRRDIRKPGFERIYGTTVLGCGCGIPWSRDHNRYTDALICETHGLTTITEFR